MSRASVMLWFGLVIAASLLLYHTSDRVAELNHQLRELDAAIGTERESIHVRWAYLAGPARVLAATERHLPLRPTTAQQVITMDELTDALPTRSEAMASVVINGTPIANVRSTYAAPRLRLARAAEPKNSFGRTIKSYRSDHMIMQRTASAAALPSSTGYLTAPGSQ